MDDLDVRKFGFRGIREGIDRVNGERATLDFDVWEWKEVEISDRDEGLVCASVLHA